MSVCPSIDRDEMWETWFFRLLSKKELIFLKVPLICEHLIYKYFVRWSAGQGKNDKKFRISFSFPLSFLMITEYLLYLSVCPSMVFLFLFFFLFTTFCFPFFLKISKNFILDVVIFVFSITSVWVHITYAGTLISEVVLVCSN